MKLCAILAFALGVQALPSTSTWSYCLSDAHAKYLVDGEATVLKHTDIAVANKTGQAIYAANLNAYSDSINALYQAPLGKIVETSRAVYLAETLSTPPLAAVNTLNIVHDCTTISWHWELIGVGPLRIRGFTLMSVNDQGQIYLEQVEFNSYSWALDGGFTITLPTSGPYAGGQ